MTTFTDPFGGSTVQPAEVAYRAVALTADVTLVWPVESTTPTDFVARLMDVTPTGAFSITMPDATAQSTGFDILLTNKGAFTFTVKDSAGNTLTTLTAGQVKYLYITSNVTTAGVWGVFAFGATAAAPDAASLAGLGLAALGSVLQTSTPTVTISSPTTITAASRAKTYVWTGGTGALTLPMVGSIGSDFEFEIRNQGTGVLTIQPSGGEFIDAASSIALQLNESCIVHSSTASNWYTVGRGRNQQFSFTLLSKAVTGGTVTLTSVEASNVVQKYTGALVSNCNVVLPGVVQVYYVSNQTSGAFTLTFKTAGVGSTVTVPSGQNAVLFCDGTNVINASTTVSGLSSLLLAQGSPTAPSIGYNGDSSTGIYQPVSTTVAITLGGTEYSRFTTTGLNSTAFVPTSATIPTLGMYGATDVRFAVASTLGAVLGAEGFGVNTTIGALTNVGPQLQVRGRDATHAGWTASVESTGSAWLGLYSGFTVADLPSIIFNNTGVLRFGTSTAQATTGYSELMRLTSAGQLGLGRVPSTTLDVQAAAPVIRVTAATGTNSSYFNAVNTGGLFYTGLEDSTGSTFATGVAYAGVMVRSGAFPLIFMTNAAERLRLDANGNAGFSQPSPTNFSGYTTVEAKGKSSTGSGLFLATSFNGTISGELHAGGGTGVVMGALTNHPLFLVTNDVTRVTVDTSGRVGIGTVPNSPFDVRTTTAGALVLLAANTGALTTSTIGSFSNLSDADLNINISGVGAATKFASIGPSVSVPLIFNVANAEKARLDTSGNLGIGASSLTAALEIARAAAATAELALRGNANAYAAAFSLSQSATAANVFNRANTDLQFGTNATVRAVITNDGRLYGTAIHNNAGAVTGTANQYFASGTYSPTLTNSTNCAAVGLGGGTIKWTRLGNIVRVSGTVAVTVTTSGVTLTSFTMTLPPPGRVSNFASGLDVAGNADGLNPGNTTPHTDSFQASGTIAAQTITFTAAGVGNSGSNNYKFWAEYEVA